jgi:hypothetical protein
MAQRMAVAQKEVSDDHDIDVTENKGSLQMMVIG